MDRLVAVAGRLHPAHVDLQEPAAALLAMRDERPAADLPAHDAALVVELVLRRVEADQHERPADQHDGAVVLAVGDADQPQRAALEEAPVGPREALERLRRPQLKRRLAGRDRQLGGLDGARRAVGVDRRSALGVDDADLGRKAGTAADD